MVSVVVMMLCFILSIMIAMGIVSSESGDAQTIVNGTADSSSQRAGAGNETRIDLMTNPNFTFFNETAGLPSYWSDPLSNCKKYFSCTIKFTDGWNDYVSFSLSTTNNTKDTWSSIHGQEIVVKPKSQYQLVSHMKLNNWATQSHVALEGFNQSSKQWYEIKQCPSGINGPLDWQEFNCFITVPENTTKIRPVLNAGWASLMNKEATSWFDSINILSSVPA
jgi:hypothetical protein